MTKPANEQTRIALQAVEPIREHSGGLEDLATIQPEPLLEPVPDMIYEAPGAAEQERVREFTLANRYNFGGMAKRIIETADGARTEDRPCETFQQMIDLYSRFAGTITPDKFRDIQRAVYNPLRQDAWDIQTGKLRHSSKKERRPNIWTDSQGKLIDNGMIEVEVGNTFYTQTELNAAWADLMDDRFTELEQALRSEQEMNVRKAVTDRNAHERFMERARAELEGTTEVDGKVVYLN